MQRQPQISLFLTGDRQQALNTAASGPGRASRSSHHRPFAATADVVAWLRPQTRQLGVWRPRRRTDRGTYGAHRGSIDARLLDPTQGTKIGSEPYDDPTQGRQIGSDPYDDPTKGR
jgi:hypothetical protein